MDPLQWMGAVRIRVQTADNHNNPQVTTPVHQLTPCEAKRCVFALDLCIFLSWFRQDNFFTAENNVMDRGLILGIFKMA